MNRAIYYLILLLFFSCENRPSIYDATANFDFKTTPKTCVEREYSAISKDGKYEAGQERSSTTISFNSDGYYYKFKFEDVITIKDRNRKGLDEIHIIGNDTTLFKGVFFEELNRCVWTNNSDGDSTVLELKGNIVTTYYPNGARYVSTLDENAKSIKGVSYNNEGEPLMSATFTYNKEGLLKTRTIKSTRDTEIIDGAIRFEYVEFDKRGNWTKRLAYEEAMEKPKYIAIREFEY